MLSVASLLVAFLCVCVFRLTLRAFIQLRRNHRRLRSGASGVRKEPRRHQKANYVFEIQNDCYYYVRWLFQNISIKKTG